MSEEGLVGTRDIRSVLHPTDFSESSRLAFAHALRMALSGHTKMYVGDAGDMPSLQIDQAAWSTVERTIRSGDVVTQILHADPEASDEPDWSIQGVPGRGPLVDRNQDSAQAQSLTGVEFMR